jgi:two-component system, OmpR family, sensor histidine kinase KdpD
MHSLRRTLIGAVVAIGGFAALSALMVAVRPHLPAAAPALVLVIPVVVGVAVGGFGAGCVAVVGGFFAYDSFFIAPFYTLRVARADDWIALAVYAIVMLVVARVVSFQQHAQAEARRREDDTRQLYVLSDLLIADNPLSDLLGLITSTILETFSPRWVALLLPDGDSLTLVAAAGETLAEEERAQIMPLGGHPEGLVTEDPHVGITRLALSANDRSVGLLALADSDLDAHDWALLRTYANHAALAIERSRLREQVVRTELLEQIDRWRNALMGAVSHDLRTPLASVKAAISALRRHGIELTAGDRDELLELAESQSDGLARLVTNLLDMTRIQSGALELRREVGPVSDVIDDALRALDVKARDVAVVVTVKDDLPLVDVDQLLMVQTLCNLVENALQHSPPGQPVEIEATARGPAVELAVRDHGPGLAPNDRERVFEMFNASGGGRAGLGLAIAKSFVEAHGQSIWAENMLDGGARFVFTLTQASMPADVA